MRHISKGTGGSILLTELFSALYAFTEENFQGLIALRSDCGEGDRVKISAEYIIYFLKLMLKCTEGERFFRIYASCENGVLTVRHNADYPFSLSRAERSNLTCYALKAGFNIKFTDRSIILYAELDRGAKIAAVYNRTAKSLSKIFEQALLDTLK